ncbi:MAG: YhgE/Pip family protein [Clostridiaceae bacterium]
MKNILTVFSRDAKRLTINVVAIVVVIGLSIIPALYAWFNIFSNWNPYGEEATSQMKIAVCSEDKGLNYNSLSQNVGDSVVEGLKTNVTIGWVFTETKEEALDGVNSGEYYAALVLPKTFTQDILSFVGGNLEHPVIEYYENSKKNAIATKITSKAKTAVQEQVNATFVSTLTEMVTKSSRVITDTNNGEESLLSTTIDELEDMDRDLETYVNILGAFSMVSASTSDLVGSTQAILPNIGGMVDSGKSTVNGLEGSVLSGAQTAQTVGRMVDISLDTVYSGLGQIDSQIGHLTTVTDMTNLVTSFEGTKTLTDYAMDVVGDYVGKDNEDYIAAMSSYEQLATDIDQLSTEVEQSKKKIVALQEDVNNQISACQKSIKSLKNTFDNEVLPSLNNSIYSVEYSLIQTESMLNGIDGSFSEVDKALGDYQQTLATATNTVQDTKNYVEEMQKQLGTVLSGLKKLNDDEQYQGIVQILSTNPELIASFIASPVKLETKAIYEIENYGSAMAPFYTVLALWVGSLILVALIHVKIEPDPVLIGMKNYELFFGRYVTFFIISQIQAFITSMGVLFYLDIQCLYPFLFWLACSISSFVFSLLMYALTVAFGNVGEGIAVIIMVVQVAGAGGTFPIEVLPKIYRDIYKFLPFTYCMNAMRECVGGLYQFDYLKDMGIMGVYVIASLIIGLVVAIPFKKLNGKIDDSKEKSKVMM